MLEELKSFGEFCGGMSLLGCEEHRNYTTYTFESQQSAGVLPRWGTGGRRPKTSRYASRAPADDRVGADGSETHTCWAGAWALGLKGQRRDSSLPRERDFAVGRRERGTTLKRQDPLFFSSSLAQEKESAPIFHHLPSSRSGCPSSTNPQSPMNVAPGRLLALARLRSTVFGTTWNPESLRTGSKVLKARLRGPSMLRYYGERFSGFAGLNRAIPDLELKDVAEETR